MTATRFLSKQKIPFVLGLVFISIAYLPLISGVTAIKFDALYYYYPVYYFFAEQVQSGNIPFWFYNLNGGFPIHADVGTPFWNFTLWLFPLFGKTVYIYTLSILSHIAIAAFGMYRLGTYLKLSNVVAAVLMVCYVCSGFYAAHLQHPPYIFECAYIPLVVLFFLRTVFLPEFRNAILLGISLFFLINAGYPGFCIATLYFLTALFIGIIISHSQLRSFKCLLGVAKFLLCGGAIGALLSLPLFISYAGIAANYNHANGYSLNAQFGEFGGMTAKSLLTFLWPFASPVDAAFYKTDCTWNNVYCGIILSCVFVTALIRSKQKLVWPLAIAGFVLLILSFQGPAKLFFFKHLPLLSLIRNNGGFRIYFLLSVLLVGGLGLQYIFETKWNGLKKIMLTFIGIQILAVACLWIQNKDMFINTSLLHLDFQNINPGSFNVPLMVLVQSVINVLFLSLAILYRHHNNKISLLICADIILSFGVNLPFTGVNIRNGASFLQKKIAENTLKINEVPYDKTMGILNDIAYDTAYLNEPVHFLKNNIGLDDAQYPSMLKNYSYLIYSGKLKAYQTKNCAFFVQQNTAGNSLKNLKLDNNAVSFSITSSQKDTLVIFQNYHADWKGYLDGKKITLTQNEDGFITLPIENGLHQVFIKYVPTKAIVAFLFTMLVWLYFGSYFIYEKCYRKKSYQGPGVGAAKFYSEV